MLRILILLAILFPTMGMANDGLRYDFSFNDHLELHRDGQLISLTISNPSNEVSSCRYYSVIDLYTEENTEVRLLFEPIEGQTDCFGGDCIPYEPGPPFYVTAGAAAPYLPGESRTCKFKVDIVREFSGTIELFTSGGKIKVTRVFNRIPTIGWFGLVILFASFLTLGIVFVVRSDNRGSKNA